MRNRNSRVSARSTCSWLPGAVALTSLIAVGGCSAPPGTGSAEGDGYDVPEYTGPAPGVPSAPVTQPGSGAAPSPASTAGAGSSASSSNTGSNAPPAGNGSEQNSANGAPITPSMPAPGGTGSNGSMNQGAAGSSMVPPPDGNQGAGGSSMGGVDPSTPPSAPMPDQNPPNVTPPPPSPQPPAPPPTPQPSGPDIACPADATFCSGFESDALADGAIYQGNPGLEFDSAVSRSGDRSLVFDAVDGFNIREVVTEIPGQAFWVRLFIQTSTTFGDNDHDSLFVASTANFQEDNNAEHGPEFSEQGNQILINADDQLFNAAGPGFPSGNQGPRLTPNVWHCVEAFYDGGSGNVQFFANGQLLINAPAFSRLTYATFRFGYLQFPGHVPHVVWYDDVVVAANRVGCN